MSMSVWIYSYLCLIIYWYFLPYNETEFGKAWGDIIGYNNYTVWPVLHILLHKYSLIVIPPIEAHTMGRGGGAEASPHQNKSQFSLLKYEIHGLVTNLKTAAINSS